MKAVKFKLIVNVKEADIDTGQHCTLYLKRREVLTAMLSY